MPEQMSGWTRHGHRIDGMVQIGKPKTVARCGGPGLCVKCSAEAASRTAAMPPQHPAGPETETDANGLTEAEQAMLWKAIERAFLDTTAWSREVEDEIDRTVERIVAERVRVVEGERDAVVEVGAYAQQKEATARAVNDAARMAQVAARRTRELAAMTARAESAEAAHEAEKAAHERLRAGAESIAYEHAAFIDGEFGCCHDEDALRAGGRVAEFDGDEFEPIPPDCLGQKTLDRHLALLGGGETR